MSQRLNKFIKPTMPSLYTVVMLGKQLYVRERRRLLKCEMGWWLQQIQENN